MYRSMWSKYMNQNELLKKDQLRKKIQKNIDDIAYMKYTLQKDIEELYILEKKTNRPIGWKRKGRELRFVL